MVTTVVRAAQVSTIALFIAGVYLYGLLHRESEELEVDDVE